MQIYFKGIALNHRLISSNSNCALRDGNKERLCYKKQAPGSLEYPGLAEKLSRRAPREHSEQRGCKKVCRAPFECSQGGCPGVTTITKPSWMQEQKLRSIATKPRFDGAKTVTSLLIILSVLAVGRILKLSSCMRTLLSSSQSCRKAGTGWKPLPVKDFIFAIRTC